MIKKEEIMSILNFVFPVNCQLNGGESRKLFVELAAEGNRLPHEQCSRAKECGSFELCVAEGKKQEKGFRDFKPPLKEKGRMALC